MDAGSMRELRKHIMNPLKIINRNIELISALQEKIHDFQQINYRSQQNKEKSLVSVEINFSAKDFAELFKNIMGGSASSLVNNSYSETFHEESYLYSYLPKSKKIGELLAEPEFKGGVITNSLTKGLTKFGETLIGGAVKEVLKGTAAGTAKGILSAAGTVGASTFFATLAIDMATSLIDYAKQSIEYESKEARELRELYAISNFVEKYTSIGNMRAERYQNDYTKDAMKYYIKEDEIAAEIYEKMKYFDEKTVAKIIEGYEQMVLLGKSPQEMSSIIEKTISRIAERTEAMSAELYDRVDNLLETDLEKAANSFSGMLLDINDLKIFAANGQWIPTEKEQVLNSSIEDSNSLGMLYKFQNEDVRDYSAEILIALQAWKPWNIDKPVPIVSVDEKDHSYILEYLQVWKPWSKEKPIFITGEVIISNNKNDIWNALKDWQQWSVSSCPIPIRSQILNDIYLLLEALPKDIKNIFNKDTKSNTSIPFEAQLVNPQFAKAGGFTEGITIAGEDGTEAVISFDQAYRKENISYWQKAGKLLGVYNSKDNLQEAIINAYNFENAVAHNSLISSAGSLLKIDGFTLGQTEERGTIIYDFGGIRFEPTIQVNGSLKDKEEFVKVIKESEHEFQDMFDEWFENWKRRRGTEQYGAAHNGVY